MSDTTDIPDELIPGDIDRVPTIDLPIEEGDRAMHEDHGEVFIHRVAPLFIEEGALVVFYDGDEVREVHRSAEHVRSVFKTT